MIHQELLCDILSQGVLSAQGLWNHSPLYTGFMQLHFASMLF